MPWQQLIVVARPEVAERIAEFLEGEEALAVSFADAADQPIYEPAPGTTPLWAATRIVALFAETPSAEPLAARLTAEFGQGLLSPAEVEILQDQVWERAWLEHFRPTRYGRRLWVVPEGQSPPEPAACNLILDPGLAFGTGTHPTTALCLEWIDGRDWTGATLIDYGCGSGILGIAAALLGAPVVYAVDIDPQALTATGHNARRNGVEAALHAVVPEWLPALRADALVANILSEPLIDLAPRLAAQVAPGGALALSGILAAQAERVAAAYGPWFDLAPPTLRGHWVLLTGRRRAA